MFVENSYGVKKSLLSAKERAANQESIRKLRTLWNEFDNETRMRATQTIRCLETQEFFG